MLRDVIFVYNGAAHRISIVGCSNFFSGKLLALKKMNTCGNRYFVL